MSLKIQNQSLTDDLLFLLNKQSFIYGLRAIDKNLIHNIPESNEVKLADTNQEPSRNNNLLFYTSFFIFLYSLVAILSILGNTLILIVILRRRRMRIVTNFFLANITIANLIYTICAPLHFIIEIYGEWIFFDFMCPLLPFFSTLSIHVNTFTMIAASMERLFVIVYPFKCKLTKNKCITVICFVWCVAAVASLPWLLMLRIKLVPRSNLAHHSGSINLYLYQNVKKY